VRVKGSKLDHRNTKQGVPGSGHCSLEAPRRVGDAPIRDATE